MNPKLLQEPKLYEFLERIDEDIAEKTRKQGCPCGGVLHQACYERKPRGGPAHLKWDRRRSFCCANEGCRRRQTPPSVRFLGRKVYLGVVVVLAAAMMHGPNRRRVGKLQAELDINRRTLNRWRQWWLEEFAQSKFWKTARARFMPPVDAGSLPLSLVDHYGAATVEKFVALMKFLSPITTTWGEMEAVF